MAYQVKIFESREDCDLEAAVNKFLNLIHEKDFKLISVQYAHGFTSAMGHGIVRNYTAMVVYSI